jgi:hypothetical protein
MATTINSNTTDGVIITPDTSGEIELQADGVTKAKITANGLQDANGASLRGGSFRNLIINGDMQIAQRATSKTGITSTGKYTIDRYLTALVGLGTWTQSRSTDVPSGQGFSYSLKMDCTTADASPASGDYLSIKYGFEGQNLQHLEYGTSYAKKMTLSFWVKSNKTGTYTVMGIQDDNSAKLLSLTYTIDSADTWEKKTITIPADENGVINNDNGQGLRFHWYLGVGSDRNSGSSNTEWQTYAKANEAPDQTVNLADSTSNYWQLTGCQLEIGDGASDFEFLPYDVQLQRCMRYFEKSYSQEHSLGTVTQNGAEQWLANRNPGTPHYFLKFRTVKRATPTVTIYNSSTGGTGTFRNIDAGTNIAGSASRVGDNGTTLYSTVSTSLGQFIQFHYTAEAEL